MSRFLKVTRTRNSNYIQHRECYCVHDCSSCDSRFDCLYSSDFMPTHIGVGSGHILTLTQLVLFDETDK